MVLVQQMRNRHPVVLTPCRLLHIRLLQLFRGRHKYICVLSGTFFSAVQLFLQCLQLCLQIVCEMYLLHLLQCTRSRNIWLFSSSLGHFNADSPARAFLPGLFQHLS